MDNAPIHADNSDSAGSKRAKKQKRFNLAAKLTTAVVLILLVLLAGWLVYRPGLASTINNGQYQAVFFTNGQVYFGKLQDLNGGYFRLTDIFYLQTQAKAASKNPQQTTSQQSSDVQLIKLGSEMHGPEDEMIISKDQVSFFENLKKDSAVSTSISKYNSSQNK